MDHLPRADKAVASAIEDMPKLVLKITLMWGTRDLDTFIHKALLDGRDGERQGFSLEASNELLFLSNLNKIVRALDLAAKTSIKPSEAYRLVDDGDMQALAGGDSGWTDPLSLSTKIDRSKLRATGSINSARKPKRSLLARIFSIR